MANTLSLAHFADTWKCSPNTFFYLIYIIKLTKKYDDVTIDFESVWWIHGIYIFYGDFDIEHWNDQRVEKLTASRRDSKLNGIHRNCLHRQLMFVVREKPKKKTLMASN